MGTDREGVKTGPELPEKWRLPWHDGADDAGTDEGPLHGAGRRASLMSSLVSSAIIVTALYFGRDLLVPLALAILISFVLDPLVTWIKRFGVPRAAAVTLVVGAALGLIVATGFFAYSQLRQIGKDLPTYETTITQKLRDFRRDLSKPGVLDQYSRVFGKVEKEIDAAQAAVGPRKPEATKVEVVRDAAKPMDRLMRWAETFLLPITSAGIVIVFVFLLDRGDLRDRLLRFMGGNLHRATDALTEAGERVSKYLTMQLIVNATYGIPMTIGLLIIGVPGALVWGILAAVLRFVPYAGPLIAAVFPLTLAFAVDPGWDMVLWTLALIVALEVISNNIIEPWLYGSSTGLSTLSLILAAMFWTALWGPMGLILSTPITVVLLVAGHYLPQMRFLVVLLGNERALDEPTRIHQRLLADDADEAVELALEYAEKSSPSEFYSSVGLGTLRLATSAQGTVASTQHRTRVITGMERVIDELREQYPPKPDLPLQVACIGGRWATDSLAAEMVSHALSLKGFGSQVMHVGVATAENFAQLNLRGASLVCLCYFSPSPATHARLFARRLKRRWPDVQVIVAAWDLVKGAQEQTALELSGVDGLVTSMDELLRLAGERLIAPIDSQRVTISTENPDSIGDPAATGISPQNA